MAAEDPRIQTQDSRSVARECRRCGRVTKVLGGRADEWVCAGHPDHAGQLALVATGQAVTPSVAARCRGFRMRWEVAEAPQPKADGSVRYIPVTGGLVAIVDAADYEWLSRYTWRAAGGKEGYACTSIGRKNVLMHRLIVQPPPEKVVDHINGNHWDNRRGNLRECRQEENLRNTRSHRGTSRFKGVYWYTKIGKWAAMICLNKKRMHIGYFDDEVAAARAYDRKARELFGEFACLNFPEPGNIVCVSGRICGHSHVRGRLTVARANQRRKSEIRSSKSGTNSNSQNPKFKTAPKVVRRFRSLGHSDFGRCFGFRISGTGPLRGSCFEIPRLWPRSTGPPGLGTCSLTTEYWVFAGAKVVYNRGSDGRVGRAVECGYDPDFVKASALVRASKWGILIRCCIAASVLGTLSGCSKPKRSAVDIYLDGVVFRELGQNDLAIKSLKEAIEADPKFGDAYSELGKAYYATGDYGSAVQVFTKAVQLENMSFEDAFGLAQSYEKLGKLSEAAEVYGRAAEIDAKSLAAHMQAAKCYLATSQPLRAMAHCEAALRINDASVEAMLLSGRICEAMRDYKGAVAVYEHVAGIEPNDPNVMGSLGQAYVRAGKFDQAKDTLMYVLRIEPKRAEALRDLGYCHVKLGSLDEAIALYRRAIELDERDWQAHNGLGVAYNLKAGAGDRKFQAMALSEWRQSLAINPDQPKHQVLERLIRGSSDPKDLSLGDPNA
jgi:tetratricopeptide (TPR) repeat protein